MNVCISVRAFSTLLLKCESNSCVHTDGALAIPDTNNIAHRFLSIGMFCFLASVFTDCTDEQQTYFGIALY